MSLKYEPSSELVGGHLEGVQVPPRGFHLVGDVGGTLDHIPCTVQRFQGLGF